MDPSTGTGFVTPERHDSYATIDSQQFDFSGRNVVIVGASTGIGRVIALSYAKAGASGLAILARSDLASVKQEMLEEAKKAGRSEPTIMTLTADITNLKQVEEAAAAVKASLGHVDILINNGGWSCPWIPVVESDPEQWWHCWEVNVQGIYFVARSFLPLILRSNEKTMVAVSSIGAHLTTAGGSAYQLSKLAMLKLNDHLMEEHGGQGLLVYGIHPGRVRTRMTANLPPQLQGPLDDAPELTGDTLTFLTKERREWLARRYIDVRWDMDGLLAKRDSIVKGDLLRVKMRV